MKCVFIMMCLWVAIARADLATDLLKASDEARGGAQEGLTWKIEIETNEDGEISKREFSVRTRDMDAYVEAVSPARNRGEVYLFNDRTMWFFKPSLKKPVAISARQKLSGQAANGDIASTNYARDYVPTLETTEIFQGEKAYVLRLKAKTNNLTYDQIRYWISEKTKRALKADFLTLQGKVFKSATMEYNNSVAVHGKMISFVSKMTIVDASFANNKSVITYFNPKIGSNPANLFNVNNLSR